MAPSNREDFLREIAALAARRMAENGEDCAQAKRKAAAACGSAAQGRRATLPDDSQVEDALREYQRIFGGAAHTQRLLRMRRRALQWMERLQDFDPHLVGPVLNGGATRYSPVHLHLYAESAKDVEMALLDRGIDLRADEPRGAGAHALESIGFFDTRDVPTADELPAAILLTVFDLAARRIAVPARYRSTDPLLHPIERAGRASAAQLRQLLAQPTASRAPDTPLSARANAASHG